MLARPATSRKQGQRDGRARSWRLQPGRPVRRARNARWRQLPSQNRRRALAISGSGRLHHWQVLAASVIARPDRRARQARARQASVQ
jgi:hypothetical protein